MLQNAYLVAKIGADTAEIERKFGEILPKIGNYPTGPLPTGAGGPFPGADYQAAAVGERHVVRLVPRARISSHLQGILEKNVLPRRACSVRRAS